jgi:hypothetical protein
MAENITLEEKERRLDAALDKSQRTLEAGGGVLNGTLDEILEAANGYRSDKQYKALLGADGEDSFSSAN